MGAVNDTLFSTQSDYVQTDFTIPTGTKEVNYTIFNPTGAPLTVVAAEVRFFEINYPNLWLGSYVLCLGIAIVVTGLLGLGLWVRARAVARPRTTNKP